MATPQVNRAEALRQERNRTQEEQERVSEALVVQRKRNQQLEEALTRSGALPVKRGVLKLVLKRLRTIREALVHGTWSEAHKVATAREQLDKALVSLANLEELQDEQGSPLIVVLIQLVRVKQPKHRPQSSGKPVLPTEGLLQKDTQRQRLAELEALLGRRSRFEQQQDRLLTRVQALITQPEDELWKAAGENELLRNFLKKMGQPGRYARKRFVAQKAGVKAV